MVSKNSRPLDKPKYFILLVRFYLNVSSYIYIYNLIESLDIIGHSIISQNPFVECLVIPCYPDRLVIRS